jgi:hypothetical protein
VIKPMFMTRIVMWATVPFFALVAHGAFALPWRFAPAAALAILLVLASINLERYYADDDKPDWKRIARALADEYDDKTVILTSGSQERTSLSYYWNRRSDPVPAVPTSSVRAKRIDKQIRGYDRVWLLDYKNGERKGTQQAIPKLQKRADLQRTQRFGPVVLFQYAVRGRPKPGRD